MDQELATQISTKLESLLGQSVGVVGANGEILVASRAIAAALTQPEQAARPLPITRGSSTIGHVILERELVAPAAMSPLVIALIQEMTAQPTVAQVSEKPAATPNIELAGLMENQTLWQSVEAFLANNLNLTEAAEQLGVHRNTLIYRLDKTRQLTGLDVRRFDDALQLTLSLKRQSVA